MYNKPMTPQEEQREWNRQRRFWIDKYPNLPCSLYEPMGICIPPEGIIIGCQAHPEGHFLRPSIVWC